MSSEDQTSKQIGEIMAKCWADEAFKQRLLTDANATLKAEGVAIPDGVTVKVVENSGSVVNYVLPRNPKAELSDSDLAAVAGGKCETPACGTPVVIPAIIPLVITQPN